MGLVNSVFSLFSYSIKNNVGWLKWWVLIQCWFRGELRDQRKLLLTPTSGNITHLEQKEDRSSFTFPPRSQDGEGLLPADHQPRLFPLHTHAASDDTSSLDQLKRGTDEETGSSWCLKNTKKKQKKKTPTKNKSFLSFRCPAVICGGRERRGPGPPAAGSSYPLPCPLARLPGWMCPSCSSWRE